MEDQPERPANPRFEIGVDFSEVRHYPIRGCPICNTTPSLTVAAGRDRGYILRCPECGLATGPMASVTTAVNLWNHRNCDDFLRDLRVSSTDTTAWAEQALSEISRQFAVSPPRDTLPRYAPDFDPRRREGGVRPRLDALVASGASEERIQQAVNRRESAWEAYERRVRQHVAAAARIPTAEGTAPTPKTEEPVPRRPIRKGRTLRLKRKRTEE